LIVLPAYEDLGMSALRDRRPQDLGQGKIVGLLSRSVLFVGGLAESAAAPFVGARIEDVG
jgi:hypothetical protein